MGVTPNTSADGKREVTLKKAYAPPTLTTFGSLLDITGKSSSGTDSNFQVS